MIETNEFEAITVMVEGWENWDTYRIPDLDEEVGQKDQHHILCFEKGVQTGDYTLLVVKPELIMSEGEPVWVKQVTKTQEYIPMNPNYPLAIDDTRPPGVRITFYFYIDRKFRYMTVATTTDEGSTP